MTETTAADQTTGPVHDPFAAPGALTPAGASPIVAVTALEKYYHHNHVLRGCTLEVYPKETICLGLPSVPIAVGVLLSILSSDGFSFSPPGAGNRA